VIVQIQYINPWIAKVRTLELAVCAAGELACPGSTVTGGSVPVAAALSPVNPPWGVPPTWPLAYPPGPE